MNFQNPETFSLSSPYWLQVKIESFCKEPLYPPQKSFVYAVSKTSKAVKTLQEKMLTFSSFNRPVNPLPNDKISDLSKLKAVADDNLNVN